MNKRFVLSIVISIAILGFIFWKILNFQQFVTALATVSIPLFFASDIPYLIQACLMGYRLSWAMSKYSYQKVSFKDGLFAHLFGMLGSDFSVGRTAYLSASLPFKSKLAGNVGVLSALIVVDVIVKASLGIVSALYFVYFFQMNVSPILMLFAVAVIIGGGLFFTILLNPKSIVVIGRIPYIGKRVVPHYVEFRIALEELRGSLLFLSLFPFVGWLLRGLEWWILGTAVGLNFNYFTWLMLHPLLTLVRLIPVTVTGLGAFELTLIALFPSANPSMLVTFGILDMINNSFVDVFGLKAVWGMKK